MSNEEETPKLPHHNCPAQHRMSRDYSRDEQKLILDYIIQHRGHCQLRGRLFWVDMEKSGHFRRSWQSLKEHFRKKIFPNLHTFALEKEDYDAIRFGYMHTALSAKKRKVGEEDDNDDNFKG